MVGDVLALCANDDNGSNINDVGWDVLVKADGCWQYVYEEEDFHHIPPFGKCLMAFNLCCLLLEFFFICHIIFYGFYP